MKVGQLEASIEHLTTDVLKWDTMLQNEVMEYMSGYKEPEHSDAMWIPPGVLKVFNKLFKKHLIKYAIIYTLCYLLLLDTLSQVFTYQRNWIAYPFLITNIINICFLLVYTMFVLST